MKERQGIQRQVGIAGCPLERAQIVVAVASASENGHSRAKSKEEPWRLVPLEQQQQQHYERGHVSTEGRQVLSVRHFKHTETWRRTWSMGIRQAQVQQGGVPKNVADMA